MDGTIDRRLGWWLVEVTGRDATGEAVSDQTDSRGASAEDAIERALPLLLERSAIVEVSEARATEEPG
jgi:hypothetical protein